MYRIGVIGDRESILGFKAVGLSVFPCDTSEEARKVLHRIAKQEFAIIYITEQLCRDMEYDIAKYRDSRVPAIIPIPSKDGSLGIGKSRVRSNVERGVGADILFGGGN